MKRSLILLCCAGFAPAALADYTVSPLSGGLSSAFAAPGSTVKLEIVVSSDAADVCNSAIFRVQFSDPGLNYLDYTWATPFDTLFDDSIPAGADLPAPLSAASLAGPAYPAGIVDIELSNVTTSGTFGAGMLASLEFQVPVDWSGGPQVQITVVPDTFANGFDPVTTVAGPVFTLAIPGPATSSFAIAGLLALRRRPLRT